MKRVLIVDDEYLVRLGLKTTINWNDYGYQIVGEACDGKEALALFDAVKPDILLTDIKMPVMNGLELMERIRKHRRPVQIVILSNHDDFFYARKAMSLGVTRYLLKSEINETTLIETLRSLSLESSEKQMADDETAERRNYLNQQLIGFLQPPPPGLFPNPPYRVFCLSCAPGCSGAELEGGTAEMPIKTLQTIADTALDLEDKTFCSLMVKNNIRLNLIGAVGSLEADRIRGKCVIMARNIKDYLGLNVFLGISDAGADTELHRLIAQAELARGDSFFTRAPITFYTHEMELCGKPQLRVSHSKVKKLVQDGEREQLGDYIDELFGALKQLRVYPLVKSVFTDLLSVARSLCENYEINLSTGLNREKFDYDNLEMIASLENAKLYLTEIFDTIFFRLKGHKTGYSHTIKKCLSYIEQHFAESFSLEDMARAVQISHSYLSMNFKQETGINFVSYLTRYRVEQAERLLRESNLKIYEIAERVGFSSPYYFSKVFKDMKGISCKAYRDRFCILQ